MFVLPIRPNMGRCEYLLPQSEALLVLTIALLLALSPVYGIVNTLLMLLIRLQSVTRDVRIRLHAVHLRRAGTLVQQLLSCRVEVL